MFNICSSKFALEKKFGITRRTFHLTGLSLALNTKTVNVN